MGERQTEGKETCAVSWMWRLFWSCSGHPACVVRTNRADVNWQSGTCFCSGQVSVHSFLPRLITFKSTNEKDMSSIISLQLLLWSAGGLTCCAPNRKTNKQTAGPGERELVRLPCLITVNPPVQSRTTQQRPEVKRSKAAETEGTVHK